MAFVDSHIDQIVHASIDTPGAKIGKVILIDFTLGGQKLQALNGGPHDQFNDAISLVFTCQDQVEIDRLWNALTADGGQPVRCVWLKDKFGVSWQIVPAVLAALHTDPNAKKSQRVMEVLMQMRKLEIATLQRAYEQTA
jgi:predicted 3-demethylubiquinone-9 3-methyltransferase (glyoxalase superfamily)